MFPCCVLGHVGWCYMEALVFMFNSPTFPLALVVMRGKAGSTFSLWQWRMCVMKMHDQSIVTINDALLWLLKLFFLYNHVRQQELHRQPCTIISCKQCCHRVQHSFFGHEVVVVVRAQNPMMQKNRPPVCRSLRKVGNPPRQSEKWGDSNQINLESF